MDNSFQEEYDTPDYGNLAELAEEFVYRLPGCDDVIIRKTIQSVYRDFCRKTCALRTNRRISLRHGVCAYPLCAMNTECTIDCVVGAVLENGMVLDGDAYRSNGCGSIAFDTRYLPGEDETRNVLVTCIEIPKIGSERIPRWFLNQYGDAIVSGSLARLFAMSNKMWSDPAMALDEARKYEYALTETRARYHSKDGLSSGSLNYFKRGLIV